MTSALALDFKQPDLIGALVTLNDESLDRLEFGVIGFNKAPDALVLHYSASESRNSGLDPSRVLGRPLFRVVAQCMNNDLVAGCFDAAVEAGCALDAMLDFTFTLWMKATPVTLRLLSSPDRATQFVAVRWKP